MASSGSGRRQIASAVVIASAGRPHVVGDVLRDVLAQTVTTDQVVLSVPDEASLPATGVPPGVRVVRARGLTAQRNAGIAAVAGADVVAFFDDDARVRADYLEQALRVFAAEPDVVGLTGRVLLDGAARDAVSNEAALRALAASGSGGEATGALEERQTLYGCNFAFRAGATGELFDERLPLYSWLEDHDLARRLLRHGRLVTAPGCVVVHRGVKSGGRTAHLRLGYSQVMNPAYLVRKGSFPLGLAAREAGRPVARNIARSIASPEASWRRRRLRGNALAALDVLRGRFTPERISEL